MNLKTRRAGAAIAALVGASLVIAAGPAVAAPVVATDELTDAVTAEGLMEHLEALQAIATANGGTRAAGTPGYEASAVYVEGVLEAAGYTPWRQPFSYELLDYTGTSLAQTAPNAVDYVFGVDFYPFEFSAANASASGDVTAVDVNTEGDHASTSGCEAADFAGFPSGDIALIQRGSCDFVVKVDNAIAAGASAVMIFNQGNVDPSDDRFGLFSGTLGSQRDIAVVSLTYELGAELVDLVDEGLAMDLTIASTTERIDTFNVIADSPTGRADRTVIVGAHLDSVPEGPGINDNGSGTAALLEIAQQLDETDTDTRNRVRFAFWGGEEDGLVGSSYYVSQLTKAEIKQHAVNLNFDMLGSVNYVRFIYDGDGDAFGTVGPNGSDIIESVFEEYFEAQKLPTEPTAFDGRSDYFAFINAGIPAGGLFSGAEDKKTAEQAAIFGGTVGEQLDPCYHEECDTIDNVDSVVLEQLSDAAAHATLTFAQTKSAVNGTNKGVAAGHFDWKFKGNRALR